MSACGRTRFAAWRKSSYSGQGGDCVEIADGCGAVGVRDSARPGGPVVVFPAEAWGAFLARAVARR
nr:DUF397 domain-containing protein [Streptomyces armeniacus]